jgi:hypothetical protein
MSRDKSNRYQYQPWYIKLWRRRHYILIPFVTVRIYLATMMARESLPFRTTWGLAIGLAQVKMNWLHDWSEIRDRLVAHKGKKDSDGTV